VVCLFGEGVVIALTWVRIGLQQCGMVAPLSLLISKRWMCKGSLMSSVKSTTMTTTGSITEAATHATYTATVRCLKTSEE